MCGDSWPEREGGSPAPCGEGRCCVLCPSVAGCSCVDCSVPRAPVPAVVEWDSGRGWRSEPLAPRAGLQVQEDRLLVEGLGTGGARKGGNPGRACPERGASERSLPGCGRWGGGQWPQGRAEQGGCVKKGQCGVTGRAAPRLPGTSPVQERVLWAPSVPPRHSTSKAPNLTVPGAGWTAPQRTAVSTLSQASALKGPRGCPHS